MDSKKTGELIAARRNALGLTQKQVAQQLHISDRTVSRWERGVGFPDLSLLEPLAEVLGLSVLELLHGEPCQQPPSPSVEELRIREIFRVTARKLRRLRWLMVALGTLTACALVCLILLWCNPDRVFFVNSSSVSASEALNLCPFALITTQEYALADQVRETSPDKLDELMNQYQFVLQIQGEPAELTGLTSTGENFVYADFTRDQYRCILTIGADGSLTKLSCIYDDQGRIKCQILNENNLTFTRYQESRMLLAPLVSNLDNQSF